MLIWKRWLQFALAALGAATLGLFLAPGPAGAHCDTLDGPVALEAQLALAKGEVTPVLKWVQPDDEAEVRAAFNQTWPTASSWRPWCDCTGPAKENPIPV